MAISGRVVVSCQADEGDAMDDLDTLTRMARAVLDGGAGGLRAEGASRIAAFRGITKLPIIGIKKSQDRAGEVYITRNFADARLIHEAGADVVALDCTRRRIEHREPDSDAWTEMIPRIHAELGRPVLADIATLEDALGAERAGADAVATTLYGYTADTAGRREPSWALVKELVARLSTPVVVEGHITAPEQVGRAFELGAYAVIVGSAITRPRLIAERFVAASRTGREEVVASGFTKAV